MQKPKIQVKQLVVKFWPLIFIVFAWFIFSWPFFSKGLVPFPSDYLVARFPPWQYFFQVPVKNPAMPDVLSQLYPWRHLVVDSFKSGQWPLWNPYLFSGAPLLANFQSAAFSPLNILFLLFSFPKAWSLLILLQPLMAGIFMLLFLRELNISKWGALVGAISFSYCGFAVVWMAYGTLTLAFTWLPLILWSIEKTFKKVRIPFLTLISFSLSFSIFSGHFQTSLYVLLVSLSYAIFKFWQTRYFKTLLLIIGFFAFGLLLAAPQTAPSVEFYLQSVRGLSFKQTEVIPWLYLATLWAPDFFGNPVTRNVWFGHYAEWAGFIGVWPLTFGIVAFWRERTRREVLFFFLLGIVALLFALETPLADFLVRLQVPALSTSAASRVIAVFSFSFSVLAGFGLDSLKKDWEDRKKFRATLLFFCAIYFVFFLLWCDVLFLRPFAKDYLMVALRNLIFPNLIFVLGVVTLGSAFFLRKNLKMTPLLVILLLVSFDSLRFAKKWMPFEKPDYLYPPLAVTEFLQKEVGNNRLFGNFGNELSVYFHLPSIEGYDPLYPKRYKEIISAAGDGKISGLFSDRSTVLLQRNGRYSPRLLSLLGVKYILSAKDDGWSNWVFPFWENLDQYNLIYDGPKYQVLENKNVLPRVFLVGDYEVIGENKAIIDRLLSEDFNLEKEIILEEKPEKDVSPGNGEAKITNYTPGKIDIDIKQNKSQLLFLSDNFYPGWQAKVDGEETKIYRADYTFRAIFVPEGQHLVEFVYHPLMFRIPLFLSGGTLLFLIFANLLPALGRRSK